MSPLVFAIAWLFSPTATSAVPDTIPFELVRGQIVLTVVFDQGDTLAMLLDTGLTPSTLALDIARRRGLVTSDEPVGYASGAGTGTRMAIYPSRIDGARIGRTRLDGIDAVSLDAEPLAQRLGRPLGGVLGISFLRGRIVRIDYPNRRLIIDPEGPPPGVLLHSDSLLFVPGDIMPLVKIEVNGQRIPASLDTGSSMLLELFPRAAATAGLVGDSTRAIELRGARGAFLSLPVATRSVRLGAAELSGEDVHLSPARGPDARWGNLGNGFLRHFVLTLDYAHGRIALHAPAQ